MSNPQSTALTPLLDEHSVGAFPTSSIKPWDPIQSINWTRSVLTELVTDEYLHGSIAMTTSIDVTGEISPQAALVAAQRVMCIYVLGRMNQKSIDLASETLVDIYKWQIANLEVAKDSVRPLQRLSANAAVRQLTPVPFLIEET